MGRCSWLTGLSIGFVCACGAAQSSAPSARIAVLPASWETRDALGSLDERQPLVEGLRSAPSLTVLEPERRCEAQDDECARALGRSLQAGKVVGLSMAALGETVLARVSVLDVAEGTRDETRQRVVADAATASVSEALAELGRQIAEPYLPEIAENAWYEEWWVWTLVGTAVVGGVAVALGVALDRQGGPDVVIVPP